LTEFHLKKFETFCFGILNNVSLKKVEVVTGERKYRRGLEFAFKSNIKAAKIRFVFSTHFGSSLIR
jgi:hypothetical protein